MIIILSILDYFFSFISRYKNRIKNFDNFDSLIFLVKTHLSSLSFFLLFLKILDCWTFPVQCTREEYQENRNEIKTKISITSPWILPWFPSDLYSSLFLRTSNISWYFINDLSYYLFVLFMIHYLVLWSLDCSHLHELIFLRSQPQKWLATRYLFHLRCNSL